MTVPAQHSKLVHGARVLKIGGLPEPLRGFFVLPLLALQQPEREHSLRAAELGGLCQRLHGALFALLRAVSVQIAQAELAECLGIVRRGRWAPRFRSRSGRGAAAAERKQQKRSQKKR